MEPVIKTSIQSSTSSSSRRQIGVISLALITYFNVSGGPWGSEPIIQAGGPLIGMLCTFLFPWIWCLPLALIFAELFTAFPNDGSFCTWVGIAFGRSIGFQLGFWSWVSGVIDNAIYPCLIVDTIVLILPNSYEMTFPWIWCLRTLIALLFMLPTLFSIRIVGRTLLILGIVVCLPFILTVCISIPHIHPSNWFIIPSTIHWSKLFSVLYWNYSGFDAAGAYAGEIASPNETYPKAMILTVFMIGITYLIPFIAITGVNEPNFSTWSDGSYSMISQAIGGHWLSVFVIVSSIFGNLGLYIAEMTKDGFQLAGMADSDLAPQFFSKREECNGVPRNAIYLSFLIIVVMGAFDFDTILGIDNFLSALAAVVEMMAAIKLRFTHPEINRPYKVPLSNKKLILWMIFPLCLGIFIMWNELVKSSTTFWLNILALSLGLIGSLFYRETSIHQYLPVHSPPIQILDSKDESLHPKR